MNNKYEAYTEKQIQYIREIASGTKRTNEEITKMFNKKFNQNRKICSIKNIKSKHDIHSYKNAWTEEQVDYLIELAQSKTKKEIIILINEKFNESKSENSLKYILRKNNIKLANDGRFKEGDLPDTTLAIGAERIRGDGYTYIKTKNFGGWRPKQRVIYEEKHGKIPPKHLIIFADNNKRNFDIDNLILLSRGQLTRLHHYFDITSNAEITKSMINVVKLEEKISNLGGE